MPAIKVFFIFNTQLKENDFGTSLHTRGKKKKIALEHEIDSIFQRSYYHIICLVKILMSVCVEH